MARADRTCPFAQKGGSLGTIGWRPASRGEATDADGVAGFTTETCEVPRVAASAGAEGGEPASSDGKAAPREAEGDGRIAGAEFDEPRVVIVEICVWRTRTFIKAETVTPAAAANATATTAAR